MYIVWGLLGPACAATAGEGFGFLPRSGGAGRARAVVAGEGLLHHTSVGVG